MILSVVGILTDQWVVERRRGQYNSVGQRSRMHEFWPGLLLFVALVSQLWVRLMIVQRGYELEGVRKAALENDGELRQLKAEYALLSRPVRIQEKAVELGLLQTPSQRIRRLGIR